MDSIKKRSIAGTAALVATFITVALATPLRAEPVAVKVAYGDLDVSSKAGAVELRSRIRQAAAQVCRMHGAQALAENFACRRAAVDATRGKVAMITDSAGFRLAAR